MKFPVAMVCLVGALAFAVPTAARQTGSRTIYASVLDSQGAPLRDLRPADVAVTEDNQSRQVTAVEHATAPATIALIVDEHELWSGSTKASIQALVTRMPQGWKVGLFSAERPEMKIVDFTSDPSELLRTIRNFAPITPAHNDADVHLEALLQWLTKQFRRTEFARPVVLAMGPQGTSASWDLVAEDLLRTHVTLFAATLHRLSSLVGNGVEATGGRSEVVLTEVGLPTALNKILDDIAGQFAITYTAPAPPKNGFHLRVKVNQPDVDARAPERVY